jgi:NAD(P)H-nitrite reductase large subunit
VVVGNGMAGARAVEEVLLRGGGDQFDIVIFGDEPYGNYNRILLSDILSGAQDPGEIFINALDWYRENNIVLHAGAPVVKIDRAAKVITSEAGVREAYDRLLIATGSRAFIPPIPGVFGADKRLKSGVFGFRNIDDSNGITARAKQKLPRRCNRRRPAWPRGSPWTPDPSLRSACRSSCQAPDGYAARRASLRAGLAVERAIVVDNQMRSVDDANIYAVGECVQHRGRVYGLVAPLWEQSKVFADHITQRNLDAAYHGSKLATKLKVMGVELASMGITEPIGGDELIQFAEPKKGTYKKLIVRDGHLVGGILMGDISKAAYLMQAFHRDAPLPEERLSLLFDLGSPNQKITIDEMPADMQVCNCNGVTKAALGACVAAGNRTTKALMDATRAGKGCGSCKNLVAEVVLWFCGGEVEEDPSIHGVPLYQAATHRSCTRTEPQVRVGRVQDAGGRHRGCREQACARLSARIDLER